ncbi:hypothetical protein CK203_093216 [Vitis vinifera]|uniref:AIPP2-like SPOC-like domain-containing protein n=1 Tax=Vitis vinifera TaxID=29760 RepID=A0A438CMP6_VITVI|nr:hypothetical protein CK203_093216 [Vitis vinifera]
MDLVVGADSVDKSVLCMEPNYNEALGGFVIGLSKTMHSSVATVCQKCGDRGYYEALTYCTKCHTSAEHRQVPSLTILFFMLAENKLPEKLDEVVTDWMCEGCAPRISKESPLSTPSSVPARTGDRLSKIHEKDQTLGKHGQSVSDDAGNFIEEAEFVKTNASEITTGKNLPLSLFLPLPSPPPLSLLVGNFVFFPLHFESHCSETYEKYQELGKQRKLVHEDQGNTREEAEPAKDTVSELAIIGPSNTPELDPSNVPEFSCFVHAQPVVDPIWRGSFSICNENFDSVNGLAAHLSSKACLKVCQQASLLPALLCPQCFLSLMCGLKFPDLTAKDEKVLIAWCLTWGKQVSLTSCQVDDRHLIPKSSKESVTSSNLANDAGIRKEKDTQWSPPGILGVL